jgi:hypothetical protein
MTLRFLLSLMLLCNLTSMAQQSESNPSPDAAKAKQTSAPVPAQITSARKLFVANGGGENLYKGGPDRAYNQFYAAMKGLGPYELTTTPADADLVLEISQLVLRDGDNRVVRSELKLTILDPKTHVSLWSLSEPIERKIGVKTGFISLGLGSGSPLDRDFDKTMTKLVDDFKKLSAPPATK